MSQIRSWQLSTIFPIEKANSLREQIIRALASMGDQAIPQLMVVLSGTTGHIVIKPFEGGK